jgi:glutathione peroxidase
MDKIDVNGPNSHPVFRYLRGKTKELINLKDPQKMNQVPWNFCRWVIDKNGKI